MAFPLIFERGAAGRQGVALPAPDGSEFDPDAPEDLPPALRRLRPPALPEVSELEVVRHYTALSRANYGVDSGFYPLGSCTMKYNPKVDDLVAGGPGWRDLHPLQPEETVQGLLELWHRLETALAEISGTAAVSLQPAAGAQGELTGMLIVRAFLEHRGDPRPLVLVPDSAHGTNPASAAMAGFAVKVVPSNRRGRVDLAALQALMGPQVAGLMLTNPNTLGLFEDEILEIAELVHRHGGLLYYDGANANAIVGKVRPGDMGFDVVHLNLHKTFATPHGGGGPGAGPVGVQAALEPFLPGPRLVRGEDGGGWRWQDRGPLSIGRMQAFHGNVGVLIRAYAYLAALGGAGLAEVAETAVLNANYLLARLSAAYRPAFPGPVMHEFVLTLADWRRRGLRAMDVAKRLIDYGYYPPTVYFPLVVEEAMMVEPTETESKETLDAFADAMLAVAREAGEAPDRLLTAPQTTALSRLDEARAARQPDLRWRPPVSGGPPSAATESPHR